MTAPQRDSLEPTAWAFLALGSGRQFAGNTGYDDLPSRYYRYDSTVPNHKRVRAGDLALLRNSDRAIGMGWISEIDEHEDVKLRRRCPQCGTTALKARREKQPRFRCDRGHEFDQPGEETVSVVCYRADYGRTWQPLGVVLDAQALTPLYRSRAEQHAIRELRLGELITLIGRLLPDFPDGWWDGVL